MEKYDLLGKVNSWYYHVYRTENIILIRQRSDLKLVFAMKKVKTSEGEEKVKIFFEEESFLNLIGTI